MSYGISYVLRDWLRSNINMANITAFSTRPIIIVVDEEVTDDGSGDQASGVIELANEIRRREYVTFAFEHEWFTINGVFYLDAQTAKTSTQEYLEEIKAQIDSANDSTSRSYLRNMDFEVVAYYPFSIVNLTFTLKKEFAAI